MNLEKVNERLAEIGSERAKTESTRTKFVLTKEKLTDSLADLKRHREDEAAREFDERITMDSNSPAGVVDGVLTLKAVQPKVQQLEDNIAKCDGSILAANRRIRSLDSEKEGLLGKRAHLVNLDRLKRFIAKFYKWADVYKESEALYLDAQSAAIEMKAEGFKVSPALKELGIVDELVQQVLGCSWILKDNPIEALQQVARPNITSKPELNPFYDFGGRKRRVRGNNLTSDFRSDHLGQGFSHMAADLDRAREATYNI